MDKGPFNQVALKLLTMFDTRERAKAKIMFSLGSDQSANQAITACAQYIIIDLNSVFIFNPIPSHALPQWRIHTMVTETVRVLPRQGFRKLIWGAPAPPLFVLFTP